MTTLSLIVITPEDIKSFLELMEWASKKENWYDVEANVRGEIKAPGEDKRYVRFLGDMQCIFSFTIVKSERQLFRHLSISVALPDHIPNLHMTLEIARLMGFVGEPREWHFGEGVTEGGGLRNKVILQEIPWPAGEL